MLTLKPFWSPTSSSSSLTLQGFIIIVFQAVFAVAVITWMQKRRHLHPLITRSKGLVYFGCVARPAEFCIINACSLHSVSSPYSLHTSFLTSCVGEQHCWGHSVCDCLSRRATTCDTPQHVV